MIFYHVEIVHWASDIWSWTAFRILIATSPHGFARNTHLPLTLTESSITGQNNCFLGKDEILLWAPTVPFILSPFSIERTAVLYYCIIRQLCLCPGDCMASRTWVMISVWLRVMESLQSALLFPWHWTLRPEGLSFSGSNCVWRWR